MCQSNLTVIQLNQRLNNTVAPRKTLIPESGEKVLCILEQDKETSDTNQRILKENKDKSVFWIPINSLDD